VEAFAHVPRSVTSSGRIGEGPATGLRLAAAGVAAGLFGLGLVFLARPQVAGRLFGLQRAGSTSGYIRALGIRDLALAAGLTIAAAGGPRRGLMATAGIASFIPFGDFLLVALRPRRPLVPMVLHGASFLGLLGLAAGAAMHKGPTQRSALE
jgi:hypothetical protein